MIHPAPDRSRKQTKPAFSSIPLLHRLIKPSVIILLHKRRVPHTKNAPDDMHQLLERLNHFLTQAGVRNHQRMVRAGLLIIVLIALLGGAVDILNTVNFGQIDLRNRVVGARVMLLDQNPYNYLWHPGESDKLLDPYPFSQNRLRSAVTVTPTVLAIQAVIADLPYTQQKFIWLFVQMALLGGLIWLAMRRAENPETRAMVLLLGIMFSCSTFWRLHVERGQAYVLFVFFAVLYIASFAWKSARRDPWGGFILGLLVCLRPQMIFLGWPLLVYRKWHMVLGAVAGIGIGLLVPTLISKTIWPDYVHAMGTYIPAPLSANAPATVPRTVQPVKIDLPNVIEGSSNLNTYAQFGMMDTTVKGAVRFYFHSPTSSLLLLGLILAGTVAWFIYVFRLRRRGVPLDYCSVMTLGLVLFVETLLPITRIAYSNVTIIAISLLLVAIRSRLATMQTWEWVLLLTAWIFSAPFPPWMSAGFRGVALGMVSQCVIMLWAMLAPWPPLPANTRSTDLNAREQLAAR